MSKGSRKYHNLCLSRRENMSYMNPKTGLQSTKEGNCYYHLNRACVLKKMPTFSPSQVVCPEDISRKRIISKMQLVFFCDTVTVIIIILKQLGILLFYLQLMKT